MKKTIMIGNEDTNNSLEISVKFLVSSLFYGSVSTAGYIMTYVGVR
jgi:hypothetical protein